MHEKRGRSNTPSTTAPTSPSLLVRNDCGAPASHLPSSSGSACGHTTTTTTTSPSTSPPPPESLEALLRLKRANMCTLRERKGVVEEERKPSSSGGSGDSTTTSNAFPAIILSSPAAAGGVPLTHFSADHFATRSYSPVASEPQRTPKTRRGAGRTKKVPTTPAVAAWKPKEVAKWLQAIELGDYAKAARKRKIDGEQLVKVVDAVLITSPSSSITMPGATDGGVVLASLGIKKLGHLKRLKRELRQVLQAASNEDECEGEGNASADGRADALPQSETQEREEELERSLKHKHKAGKLVIPRVNSAPAAPFANPPPAQSPNRLRRLVHNIAGGSSSSSSPPPSLSSSPSSTNSPAPPPPPSASSSSSSSQVSFPAIESDSDSFLPIPLGSPPSSASQAESLSPGRPRTRSRLAERLAPGMSRSRSSDAPRPLSPTSTGGSQSCSLPSFISPAPPPSFKQPSSLSASHAAVAHGLVSLVDEDDDCSSSTISSASSSSSSSASNDGPAPMTFSFSFPSSAPMMPTSSSATSSSSHSASSISVTSDTSSASSCTSLAFCSMFGEVAIKCVIDDDISLVRLNLETDLSFSGLQRAIQRVYGQRMRAHYFDLEGDKIRITNDSSLRYAYEDWRQALERSGPAISWRLHLKPARRPRTHSELSSAASPADVADDSAM